MFNFVLLASSQSENFFLKISKELQCLMSNTSLLYSFGPISI